MLADVTWSNVSGGASGTEEVSCVVPVLVNCPE